MPTVPAAGEESKFVNGTAFATAGVSRIAPGVGDLSLAITSGVATAEVRNQLAQAQAQSVDFGLIGSSITAAGCDGNESTIKPEHLPQPTRVDNRKGDAEALTDEFPIAGSNLTFGREYAKATKQPHAQAISSTLSGDLGGFITLGGGRAEAVSRIVDGNAREALATSEASIDIGGAVKLAGLKWAALHRTGKNPSAVGNFEIGSAAAFGAPVNTSELGPAEDALNAALAITGIRLEFPRIQRLKEPADLVRVTPLRVILQDSPLGSMALGPVLGATRVQREQLFIAIVEQYCRAASALLVGDITLSVASGTGFMAFEFGGAEATTAETSFENPFGGTGGLLALPVNFPGLPSLSAIPDIPPGGVAALGRLPSASIITNSGPLRDRCESIHESGPSCTQGSAVALGLIALAAIAGVAGLDWQRQRRRPSGVAA